MDPDLNCNRHLHCLRSLLIYPLFFCKSTVLHLLEIVSCVWVQLAMVGKPYQIRYWQYYTEYILTDRNCNKTGLCCSFALTE